MCPHFIDEILHLILADKTNGRFAGNIERNELFAWRDSHLLTDFNRYDHLAFWADSGGPSKLHVRRCFVLHYFMLYKYNFSVKYYSLAPKKPALAHGSLTANYFKTVIDFGTEKHDESRKVQPYH